MADKLELRECYGQALVEAGRENERIVLVEADLRKSTMGELFRQEFPERLFEVGIAEQNMIGMAAGLALTGWTAVANSFAVFASGRAFEQIRQSVALPRLNVKIGGSSAGLTDTGDGATHQSIADLAIMRSLPNMTVLSPADGIEMKQAVKAMLELDGPVYIRVGRIAAPTLYDEDYKFELGKIVVMRPGKDVTLAATGTMVAVALEAAELLAKEGIDARVLNVHTLKPLDEEAILAAARETAGIVTVEEHNIIGGLGSAVAEVVSAAGAGSVVRVGVEDVFGQSANSYEELLAAYGLTPENVRSKARSLLQKA
ncbi:MAG: transketolase family protein [Limnochordia bacterium]|nr:transketolase family protein [Bacillota bacterium]